MLEKTSTNVLKIIKQQPHNMSPQRNSKNRILINNLKNTFKNKKNA